MTGNGAYEFGDSQPMQNARRIRANIDAGGDFAEFACLFINMHVKSSAASTPPQ
jgi:hypothetical protein